MRLQESAALQPTTLPDVYVSHRGHDLGGVAHGAGPSAPLQPVQPVRPYVGGRDRDHNKGKKKFSLPLIHKQRVFVFVFVFVLQPAQVSLCAQSMVSAYLPATASTTVPMDLTRQTVVIIQALLNTSFSH